MRQIYKAALVCSMAVLFSLVMVAFAQEPKTKPSEEELNARISEHLKKGFTDVYRQGYSSGYHDAYTDAYREAYREGHSDGYKLGYTEGHSEGYKSGSTESRSK